MIRSEEFVGNNLKAASVGDVVRELEGFFDDFSHVLITSLDSQRELQKDSMINKTTLPHRFLGGGVIFEGKGIRQLQMVDGFFAGFDEIWCFRHNVLLPLPSDVALVGPLEIVAEIPSDVKKWMRESKCILGLGDGMGLNYVTDGISIANLIEKKVPQTAEE